MGAIQRNQCEQLCRYLSRPVFSEQEQRRGCKGAARTSTNLASCARVRESHDLLSPVYNCCTEGFDTKNLNEARAFLGELTE